MPDTRVFTLHYFGKRFRNEDGETPEEGNAARVLASGPGAGLFGLGREAVGIDDSGAMLALADHPAQVAGLIEVSQPWVG